MRSSLFIEDASSSSSPFSFFFTGFNFIWLFRISSIKFVLFEFEVFSGVFNTGAGGGGGKLLIIGGGGGSGRPS